VTPDPPLPTLTLPGLDPDPLVVFQDWMETARQRSLMEYPNAMVLATVDGDGFPDARIVLLKDVDERGFVFYTNRESAKGEALARTGMAGLNFYWDHLGRQVRVRGLVETVSDDESDAYFSSRPRGSQIGAWASEQSRVLDRRETLEARAASLEDKYRDRSVPRPDHWGGYVVRPRAIEFWQARDCRLHDRFLYRKGSSGWSVVRLNP
jgi:pyridoxamine 5'-phosphate oxidase